MGAIFGVISASIILSILVNLAVMLDPEEEFLSKKIKTETLFYSKIEMIIPTIVPYLKKEVWKEYIPEHLKQNDEDEDEQEKQPSFYTKNIIEK